MGFNQPIKMTGISTDIKSFVASNMAGYATDTANVIDSVTNGQLLTDTSPASIVNVVVQVIIGITTIIQFFKNRKQKKDA